MSGKAFLIVGGTGRGKTSFVARCLSKVNKTAIALYDVNNETAYKPYTLAGDLPTIEAFTEKTTRLRDAVIVYEEATIFFSNRGNNDSLREILVRKRHTNNTIFLVFHSLRNIPRYVYDLCNFVVLFKTNDSGKLVDANFQDERLSTCFERVKNNKDFHYFEMFDIYG